MNISLLLSILLLSLTVSLPLSEQRALANELLLGEAATQEEPRELLGEDPRDPENVAAELRPGQRDEEDSERSIFLGRARAERDRVERDRPERRRSRLGSTD